MKLTADGGTDIATMVIYWPELISPEMRRKYQHDPGDLAAELRAKGSLIEFPCDADGHYSVSVFVNENPPANFAPLAGEEKVFQRVTAQGPAFFNGAEYILPEKTDDNESDGAPDSESALAIPDGAYTGRVYRLETSEEHRWEWLKSRVGEATLKRKQRHESIASYAAVLILAAIITAFFTSWMIWGPIAALAIVPVAVVRKLGSDPAFEKIKAAEAEYAATFPAYVVELRSV